MALILLVFSLLTSLSCGQLPVGNCNGGKDEIDLKKLPGYDERDGPNLRMNSGFIEVNKTANGR